MSSPISENIPPPPPGQPVKFKRKNLYNQFRDVYDQYNTQLAPPATRNFGFDVSSYLPGVVGSRANRDIYIKNAWQAPASFKAWQEKDPIHRAGYKTLEKDVDGDDIPEFLVTKNDRTIAVNGYTTRRSEYPYRRDYYETYPTKEDRKDHKMNEYWQQYDPELNADNLEATWQVDEDELKKKHIRRKLPKEISPYKHFVKMIAKPNFDAAKEKFAEANLDPQDRELLSVPGTIFTKLCAEAWQTLIIVPLAKMKPGYKDWLRDKANMIRHDHPELPEEVVKERAWQTFKSNRQFKKDVEAAYLQLLGNEKFHQSVEVFYQKQFPSEYAKAFGGKIKLKSTIQKHNTDKTYDTIIPGPSKYNPFKNVKINPGAQPNNVSLDDPNLIYQALMNAAHNQNMATDENIPSDQPQSQAERQHDLEERIRIADNQLKIVKDKTIRTALERTKREAEAELARLTGQEPPI